MMLGISAISGEQCYRVNPVYLKYLENYSRAAEDYKDLEAVVKNGQAKRADIAKYDKAERAMRIAENGLRSVNEVVEGGHLDKSVALAQANEMCGNTIDYYC